MNHLLSTVRSITALAAIRLAMVPARAHNVAVTFTRELQPSVIRKPNECLK